MAILKPSRLVSIVSRFRSSSEAKAIECSRKSILPNSAAVRSITALICSSFVTSSGTRNLALGDGIGQQRHAAAVPLPLVVGPVGQVREAAHAAFGHDLLGDRPGDRMVVGDPQNQSLLAVEQAHRGLLSAPGQNSASRHSSTRENITLCGRNAQLRPRPGG